MVITVTEIIMIDSIITLMNAYLLIIIVKLESHDVHKLVRFEMTVWENCLLNSCVIPRQLTTE